MTTEKMKIRIVIVLLYVSVVMFFSCVKAGEAESIPQETIDIDLSQVNSIVVFSQVSNMYTGPWNYLDAIIRISGTLSFFDDTDGRRYSMVMVQDASACCAQGIEFESDDQGLSENSLSEDDKIIVTGRFKLYQEDGYSRIYLVDAVVEKPQP